MCDAGVLYNNAIAEINKRTVELTFVQFEGWNDDHASRLKRLVCILFMKMYISTIC